MNPADWLRLCVDVAIPLASIAVPTSIAIWLARRERQDNRASLERERWLTAAMPVLEDLAVLISIDPQGEDMRGTVRALRGHISGVRAALGAERVLVSDWLALRHGEGTHLWNDALALYPVGKAAGALTPVAADPERIKLARDWAASTLHLLEGWLSGLVDDEALRNDGARILHTDDPPTASTNHRYKGSAI